MGEGDIRVIPTNDLDLQLQVTNPQWGSGSDIAPELKIKLSQIEYELDENGKIKEGALEEKLWGLLSFYTRDIRLGNLSSMDGELKYTRYYLDLAGDCLREGYINTFMTALSRAITILETSQSKGGFLRKLFSTIIQHKTNEEIETKKTGLLGSSTKKMD